MEKVYSYLLTSGTELCITLVYINLQFNPENNFCGAILYQTACPIC